MIFIKLCAISINFGLTKPEAVILTLLEYSETLASAFFETPDEIEKKGYIKNKITKKISII